VLADPREVAANWPEPRMRAIAALALAVTEAPWTLSRSHLAGIYKAGLGDEDILHVVLLSSFFGHLNRIADAVQGPLDYEVRHQPPRPDRSIAPWPTAPSLVARRPAIDLARRPATATALTEWRHYIFYSRDTPLSRRQRTVIARWVATWLGDGGISSPADLTGNPLDDALRLVAEVVTLAPWRIDEDVFTPLRAAGFDDAAIFDVCATASSAGVFSRYEVALAALGA
jgi:alkylhydroperoxidase family enzyme